MGLYLLSGLAQVRGDLVDTGRPFSNVSVWLALTGSQENALPWSRPTWVRHTYTKGWVLANGSAAYHREKQSAKSFGGPQSVLLFQSYFH